MAGLNILVVKSCKQVCNKVGEGLLDVGAYVYKGNRIQNIHKSRWPTVDTFPVCRVRQNHRDDEAARDETAQSVTFGTGYAIYGS